MRNIQTNHFHWLDYILFIAMFAVCIGIGIYHGLAKGGQRSTESYFMGDRKMSLIPVMLSITVSVISGNTILGCPAEIYLNGAHYFFAGISCIFGGLVVAWLFVPLLYQLKVTSIHEYLEQRFQSKAVRLMGTCMLFLIQATYIGTVIFGPAIALETATSIPAWGSILLVSILGTAYTAVGGMKAVIWTDAFQAFVIIGGTFVIIVLGANEVGGIREVWNINKKWGRLHLSFDLDPTARTTVWTYLVGFFFLSVSMYGANQPCAQRACAMATEWQGRKSMALNGPMFALMTTLSTLTGLVVFAYYASHQCDPLEAGLVSNANQILPYFVMDVINYPGIPGVFMACLFSAALSTLSSSVNSMTAVLWEDVLKSYFEHLSEAKKALFTKVIAAVFGVFCMGVSFLVWIVGGNLIQIGVSLTGSVMGPILGLFVLGAAFPWANWIGAIVGGIFAVSLNCFIMVGQILNKTMSTRLPAPSGGCDLWLDDGQNTTSTISMLDSTLSTTPFYNTTVLPTPGPGDQLNPVLHWLFSVSFSWYIMGGMLVTVAVGAIVSVATGGVDPSEVESRLYFSFLRGSFGKNKGTVMEKEPNLEMMLPEHGLVVQTYKEAGNGTV